MRIFICDNCDKQFPQPLDEEKYKDINGNLHSFDLCAPCRSELKGKKEKPIKDFFNPLVDKKKAKK